MTGAAQTQNYRLRLSAADRWMVCPGSVALIDTCPPKPETQAMRDGTKAHSIAERALTDDTSSTELPYAVRVYVDHVRELLAGDPFAELTVERRYDLSVIDPEIGGTTDCAVYLPLTRTLHVRDYKNGSGNVVSVDGNNQLLGYAYGAWLQYRDQGVDTITVGIVQPRAPADDVRVCEITPRDLEAWADRARAAALATRAPMAPCVPGEHCSKTYCEAAIKCGALKGAAFRIAIDGMIAAPQMLSNAATLNRTGVSAFDLDEIGRALSDAVVVQAYIDVLDEVRASLKSAGVAPPGWKIVPHKLPRAWSGDLQQVRAAIAKVDSSVDPHTLRSPADIERSIGKASMRELAGYITSPETTKLVRDGK